MAPLTVTGQAKEAPAPDVTLTIGSDYDTRGHQVSIWPANALAARVGGRVTLACQVDIHGLAERCAVVHEDPVGQGFGGAALALRPTLKLTPKQGPEGPIPAMMNIAIVFKPPAVESPLISNVASQANFVGSAGTEGNANVNGHTAPLANVTLHNNPIAARGITMMTNPAWAAAPDFAGLAAAYPAEAGGVEGYAVAHCRAEPTGVLTRCKAVKEAPTGHGFGKAAAALAPQFRLPPEAMAQAPHGAPVEVDVPIRFPASDRAAERWVRAPSWLVAPVPETTRPYFPSAARARKVTHGAAVLRCEVAAGGGLTDCEVQLARPDGVGFDEAAMKVAAALRVNLWSADAQPVQGGVIHVPVEFEADN